ncbi:MAG TPA: class I SAM-dependent methyltransferase [Labilithrix sp.]|jgi:predicted O-methyltransferase YrrM|nr:class I SAM-dependent methyltransferase [Labilithrix sp.]
MRLRDIPRLRDPRLLWQRLVLYSKRVVPRIPWQDVEDFPRLWPQSKKRTLVDEARAQMLYQLARHASCLDGAFAEIGVYRGGTAKILAHVADSRERKLHLFDTFQGMPETDIDRDLLGAGDFADTSLAEVKRFLAPHASPIFHQGEFPATAGPVENERFSLVHVDADIASSVEACCEFFYPRLVPGGVIVFDDYGFTSTPGAKTTADAFFAKKPEPLLHLVTAQAIAIKQ